MSDLVERLRDRAKRLGPSPNALLHFADGILPLLDEAATELASLRERVKELEVEADKYARTPPGEMEAPHNSGEREPSVMPAYSSGGTELRVQARLAWNGWPDTAESRRIIADHEARDKLSANAWDRVIAAILATIVHDEAAIRQLAAGKEKGDGE